MGRKKRSDAELAIIKAAEKWAREILKMDYALMIHEEDLFYAVMEYNNTIRGKIANSVRLPAPPKLPVINHTPSIEEEIDTLRYSALPTTPSPETQKLALQDICQHEIDSIIEEIRPSVVLWVDGYC